MSAPSVSRALAPSPAEARPHRPGPEPSAPEPLLLYNLESSLATSGLDRLEALARRLSTARVATLADRIPGTAEAALLSTCHRVELFLVVESREALRAWQHALPAPRSLWTLREGREAVVHLFRVAAGRESMAVGEREVREQVRVAADRIRSRYPRPLLEPVFRAAVRAADEIAPEVPMSRSIAAIAATRLLEVVARPFPRVLVIGTGIVGRQVAELLAPCARVTLAYRRHPPDPAFLRAIGGRTVGPAELAEELRLADAVVTATKSGGRPLGLAEFRHGQSQVVVDLGLPRNVDGGVRALPGITLVDLEDLRSQAHREPVPEAFDSELEPRARHAADELDGRLLEPWIASLRREAERTRKAELAVAQSHLGQLDVAQEQAIDRLTLRLVEKLLGPATARLRSLPAGPEGDRLRRFAVDLLRPPPPRP